MARPRPSCSGVGYKKPPAATRFKPGQSGNPRGRPKGSKNLASIIQRELATHVVVTEDGSRRKITKERAIAKQLVNKAASGDPKIISLLLKALSSEATESSAGAVQDILDSAEDGLVMASIVQRIRQMEPPSAPASEIVLPATDAVAPQSEPHSTSDHPSLNAEVRPCNS